MEIQLTENAVREMRKILLEQPTRSMKFFRLGVKAGGCAGFTYTVDLAARPDPRDQVLENHGIRLLCDRISALYLDGTVVDFTDELVRRGFIFNNPNARHACPCGVSFSI